MTGRLLSARGEGRLVDQVPRGRTADRPGLVLAVLCSASLLATLDVFIVNVALSSIGRDVAPSAPLSHLSWVLNGYTVLYAALLVPAGRLADRYGRKSGFVVGLGVFLGASLACALSPGLAVLVASRCVQAIGAALLTPASLGLLLVTMPPERRASAVRVWAASGSVAAAVGPVVGGLLLELSWRWIFLVNLPVGLVALVLAVRVVAAPAPSSEVRLPDLVGAALLVVSVGALSLGLVMAPEWGWGSARATSSWVVSVSAGAVFLRRCATHPAPVVPLRLLRTRSFAWANLTALLFAVAFGAQLLGLALWLQQGWGYTPLRTGLAIAPGPLLVVPTAALGHRLARRVPVGVVTGLGCLLFGVSALVLAAGLGTTPSYAAGFLPGWLVGGVGVGLALPTVLSSATADLAPAEAATGSAVVTTGRQTGFVLGVAVLVAVLAGAPGLSGVRRAEAVVAAVSLAAAVAAVGTSPRRTATA